MIRNILTLLFASACTYAVAIPSAGFFLPDSVFEFSMRYKTVNNLIILPVTINDSVRVNLILDTGCRNMLLFGKRFEQIFHATRDVEFSGLGSGGPVRGRLSLDNNVSIQAVRGRRIPLIVVPRKNLFATLPNVDGVIGYEIFSKFEIELNFPERMITFRTASYPTRSPEFNYMDLKVIDSRPVLSCRVDTGAGEKEINDLLIDTGSCLGLIMSVNRSSNPRPSAVGRGLNGLVPGEKQITPTLRLHGVTLRDVDTSIVYSSVPYASIGMDILRKHVVIINYARSFVAFRKTADA